jgi:hypothetical protein
LTDDDHVLESIAKATLACDDSSGTHMDLFSREQTQELDDTLPSVLFFEEVNKPEAVVVYLTLCHPEFGVFGQFRDLLRMISSGVEDSALEG